MVAVRGGSADEFKVVLKVSAESHARPGGVKSQLRTGTPKIDRVPRKRSQESELFVGKNSTEPQVSMQLSADTRSIFTENDLVQI